MSDSHVNDIRYTALWRPVVKAREAPAASPPSPSPPLLPRSVGSRSLLSFGRMRFRYVWLRVSLFLPPRKSRVSVVLARCEFRRRDPDADVGTTANSICSDGKRGESVCSLYEGRGRRNRPRQLRPPANTATVRIAEWDPLLFMRGQPSFVDDTPSSGTRLPFVRLANRPVKSILAVIDLFNLWILLILFNFI